MSCLTLFEYFLTDSLVPYYYQLYFFHWIKEWLKTSDFTIKHLFFDYIQSNKDFLNYEGDDYTTGIFQNFNIGLLVDHLKNHLYYLGVQ